MGERDDDQLNLDDGRMRLVMGQVQSGKSMPAFELRDQAGYVEEPPKPDLQIVPGADPVEPLAPNIHVEDGQALWELVEKKRELTTRDLSPELARGLARSADFDAMRAQLRLPVPPRPRAVEPRRAG